MSIESLQVKISPRALAELAIRYGALQKQNELEKLAEFLITKPHETVLEIGTCKGGTLWFWHHLPLNKTVVSVDMPGGKFGGGPSNDDKERIKNWINQDQDTVLVSGDSHLEETLNDVKEALGEKTPDILFIDGDHTYEGIKKDFEMYSPLVKKEGFIIFHDIVDHSGTNPECRVREFWDDLTAKLFPDSKFYSIIDPVQGWAGIGVMQW